MLEARQGPRPRARSRSGWLPAFPLASRLGLVVIALGLVADLGAHVGPFASSALALASHWAVLAGMVLALAGVMAFGVRRKGGTR